MYPMDILTVSFALTSISKHGVYHFLDVNIKSRNKTVDFLKPNTNDMFHLSLQGMHQVHYIDTNSTEDKEQLVQQQFYIQDLHRKNNRFARSVDKLE